MRQVKEKGITIHEKCGVKEKKVCFRKQVVITLLRTRDIWVQETAC